MKTRKLILQLLTLFVVASMLVACGGGATEAPAMTEARQPKRQQLKPLQQRLPQLRLLPTRWRI